MNNQFEQTPMDRRNGMNSHFEENNNRGLSGRQSNRHHMENNQDMEMEYGRRRNMGQRYGRDMVVVT
ncbi:hypothetical protein K7432_003927 [Basidiobolus ranarum]|uniref:Uncharacterized protein n=1 Tax=Basidiobolus ranarum TaxID=34480 RepID=A0ABR2W5E3_9FUNG